MLLESGEAGREPKTGRGTWRAGTGTKRRGNQLTVWEGMAMRVWKVGAAFLFAAVFASCGGNSSSLTVTVSPSIVTVILSGTQQFTATVNGSSNNNVTWSVNTIPGGNSTVGTISSTGLYTAPAVLPSPASETITATSVANTKISGVAAVSLDSGVRVTVKPASVTIAASETLQFSATVTGASNTAVTWAVNGVNGGNSTVGTITATGLYTAPATVPTSSTTIAATSVADTTRIGNAGVTLLAGMDPTLLSLDPTSAAQGSVIQPIYVTGTNFFSTSVVRINATPLPTTFLSVTLLRALIPEDQLTAAGSVNVDVQRQNGNLSNALPFALQPVRPVVISSTPESVPQNVSGPNFTVTLDGGFFGTATLPIVTAAFNGQSRTISATSTRQLNVTLQGTPDSSQAGLFPLVVANGAVSPGSPSIAAVNIAVEPPASAISPTPTNVPVGSQPSAVAINLATGTAVVANRGSNAISLVNLSTQAVTNLAVGNTPTGVAVDSRRNLALVVNNGSNTLSVVDLSVPMVISTLPLPTGTTPISVGINPLTGRALVANSSTNSATVVDVTTPNSPSVVGTVNISTGVAPQVAIEPQLNWAVVSPGGAGTFSVVNLGRPSSPGDIGLAPFVVVTVGVSSTIRGIAINTETEQALFADPSSTSFGLFSLLDQSVPRGTLDTGEVAAAVNPLTNIGVLVNSVTNIATVVDLRTLQSLATVGVGTAPQAVAIDPVTNTAVIANQASNNVSLVSLGQIRALAIVQINPAITFTSANPLTLSVIGGGFAAGSVVRLDGAPVTSLAGGSQTFVSSRQLTATIPASALALARRYVVDVQNPNLSISNVTNLTIIQAVAVGTAPQGVAIDGERNLAVVTNSGSNTISFINLNTGTAAFPINVGTNPKAVAVLPRLGLAVVTNFGSNTATIVNETTGQVTNTIQVGSQPLGVAIQSDGAQAFVANSGSNSITQFRVDTGALVSTISTDQLPEAVAVDPLDFLLAVTNATQNTIQLFPIGGGTLQGGRLSNIQLPTAITYDPVSDVFIATSSLQNNLVILNPSTLVATLARVGINPTSVDYNPQTSTVVTINTLSHTLSVLDIQTNQVKALLNLDGSNQFSVAVQPQTNLAVVADTSNNRVLLVPLPR
jgi:YVTN family beta-propeller protein